MSEGFWCGFFCVKENQAQAISISQLGGNDFPMKGKHKCDFSYFVVSFSGLSSVLNEVWYLLTDRLSDVHIQNPQEKGIEIQI